ncbi:M15 family metallopeptidase [uncultured Pseudodesulfovibrio sp.]|uniref:M15 family metallopeptidase n=1 Tax=uncultured Pseudodesulfovibrio sp. TaxID=2035858 RepID=UPI0029C856D4|nr:M15 family metallopeptidase [uncultured Pseudodesulfovibrio sp.]
MISRNSFHLPVSLLVIAILLLAPAYSAAEKLPDGFAYVSETVPGAVLEVRYYGDNNFVGQRVDGYLAPRVILTTEAATALAQVESQLAVFGLGIKVFDGYRPQQAVDHFVRWGKALNDTKMKAQFYPDVDKKNLFRDGYIAEKSGHSRGSTVDLTIIDLTTGAELDMGTPFDFFGPKSWPSNKDMPAHVRANRALLQNAMLRNGFKPLTEEWWHFTLRDEPYPDTYFNFPVR